MHLYPVCCNTLFWLAYTKGSSFILIHCWKGDFFFENGIFNSFSRLLIFFFALWNLRPYLVFILVLIKIC